MKGRHAKLIDQMHDSVCEERWGQAHLDAFFGRNCSKGTQGRAIASMTRALAEYADAHEKMFECPIGDDHVLRPHWADMVRAVRGMLNGETGNLDCGTMDRLLCDMLRAERFEP